MQGTTGGSDWVQVAALVVSIVSLLATIFIAVIGWLAKGLFDGLKKEMEALRADREVARREHREDSNRFADALSALRAETNDSVRRVHARVDEVQKSYVPQAHCAIHMESAREWQEKVTSMLSDGLKEVREAITQKAGG